MMAGAALMAGTFMVNNLLYAKDRERLFAGEFGTFHCALLSKR